MTVDREVTVAGKLYTVTISDEQEALLAASAAGRAVVGLWDPQKPDTSLSPALYVVTQPEDADQEFLERVVRRKMGLPWIICETSRLTVRELEPADASAVLRDPEDTERDAVFYASDTLKSYIENQYRFYEWGLWAVVERATGLLAGIAGFTGSKRQDALRDHLTLEMGYHIFSPYRRRGYGYEACRGILDRAAGACADTGESSARVIIKTDPCNQGSITLASKLGFQFTEKRYTGAGRCCYLYERYLREW